MSFPKTFAAMSVALALTACATGPRDRYERLLTPKANPSAVIATELAFARAAREEGQWEAFRDYAADDAVLFVPQPVDAQEWLEDRDNPAQPASWQPHQVWSSCDGSLAVTRGAWSEPGGTGGAFTTVWRREGRGENAEYRWVLRQRDTLDQPLPEPDFIQTQVASCPASAQSAAATIGEFPERPGEAYFGQADDRTLAWSAWARPDGSRIVQVLLLGPDGFDRVLTAEAEAE